MEVNYLEGVFLIILFVLSLLLLLLPRQPVAGGTRISPPVESTEGLMGTDGGLCLGYIPFAGCKPQWFGRVPHLKLAINAISQN